MTTRPGQDAEHESDGRREEVHDRDGDVGAEVLARGELVEARGDALGATDRGAVDADRGQRDQDAEDDAQHQRDAEVREQARGAAVRDVDAVAVLRDRRVRAVVVGVVDQHVRDDRLQRVQHEHDGGEADERGGVLLELRDRPAERGADVDLARSCRRRGAAPGARRRRGRRRRRGAGGRCAGAGAGGGGGGVASPEGTVGSSGGVGLSNDMGVPPRNTGAAHPGRWAAIVTHRSETGRRGGGGRGSLARMSQRIIRSARGVTRAPQGRRRLRRVSPGRSRRR